MAILTAMTGARTSIYMFMSVRDWV